MYRFLNYAVFELAVHTCPIKWFLNAFYGYLKFKENLPAMVNTETWIIALFSGWIYK